MGTWGAWGAGCIYDGMLRSRSGNSFTRVLYCLERVVAEFRVTAAGAQAKRKKSGLATYLLQSLGRSTTLQSQELHSKVAKYN